MAGRWSKFLFESRCSRKKLYGKCRIKRFIQAVEKESEVLQASGMIGMQSGNGGSETELSNMNQNANQNATIVGSSAESARHQMKSRMRATAPIQLTVWDLNERVFQLTITKVGGQEEELKTKVYRVPISAIENPRKHSVKAIGIPHIREEIVSVNAAGITEHLGLTNEKIRRGKGPVDLLIGIDHAHLHTGQTIKESGPPSSQKVTEAVAVDEELDKVNEERRKAEIVCKLALAKAEEAINIRTFSSFSRIRRLLQNFVRARREERRENNHSLDMKSPLAPQELREAELFWIQEARKA
ncbi:Hypothetical predicted protein [Paramuricea clavata]|uniref:Uncharacterized protein n=1 Tax=Paramuricea clavata TaxID=317549 RepID=A0A6S7FNM6_PARCT|nr:Hypothetical predicted protein [Paramuricea clavata]